MLTDIYEMTAADRTRLLLDERLASARDNLREQDDMMSQLLADIRDRRAELESARQAVARAERAWQADQDCRAPEHNMLMDVDGRCCYCHTTALEA